MMKKISVLLMAFFLAGGVFALSFNATPVNGMVEALEPVLKNSPSPSVSSVESVSVGPWQSLWQMHYKWNPVTKAWDKRVFVPTPSRGKYDFKTKTWSN